MPKLDVKELINKLVQPESIISVTPTGNVVRSGTGDSRVQNYNTIASKGSKLTNDGTAIVIGSGVDLIELSFNLNIQTGSNSGAYLNGQIYKNGTQVSELGQDTTRATSNRRNISKPPVLYSVVQGDKFQIGWYGVTNDTLTASGTFLTIRVIEP